MTVINISDIINDINDIENYAEAVNNEKMVIYRSIFYYPLRWLEVKDKQSKNLDYLMKCKSLPKHMKFFSARNENILYSLDKNTVSYVLVFSIIHNGMLKFVNDTDGECTFCTDKENRGIIVEYRNEEQLDRFNTKMIIVVNGKYTDKYTYPSENIIKLNVNEFVLKEENMA